MLLKVFNYFWIQAVVIDSYRSKDNKNWSKAENSFSIKKK